ncbi:hypothetical protein D3C75_539780 [compost metagenome]
MQKVKQAPSADSVCAGLHCPGDSAVVNRNIVSGLDTERCEVILRHIIPAINPVKLEEFLCIRPVRQLAVTISAVSANSVGDAVANE